MEHPLPRQGFSGDVLSASRQRSPAMPIQKLQEFLDGHDIKYVVISHSVAYTAQGVAALTHISGKELATTVILQIDGAVAMDLLPASVPLRLSDLRWVARAHSVSLVT